MNSNFGILYVRKSRNSSAFTLVELMIAVVIVGILVAVAIPSYKKVSDNTIRGVVNNDVRVVTAAAQQYWLETGLAEPIPIRVDPATGAILPDSPIAERVKAVSRGINLDVTLVMGQTFTISHVQLEQGRVFSFTDEGKRVE